MELGCYNVRDAHWLPSILLRNTLRNPSQDHELEGNPGIPTRGAHFRISERDNQKVGGSDLLVKDFFYRKTPTLPLDPMCFTREKPFSLKMSYGYYSDLVDLIMTVCVCKKVLQAWAIAKLIMRRLR